MTARAKPDPDTVLAETVFAGGHSKPLAERTADEVRARAEELKAASGRGPTAKVASVAMAWGAFARLMEEQGAATVARLMEEQAPPPSPTSVATRSPSTPTVASHWEFLKQRVTDKQGATEKLWVVPPGGSLL